MTLFRRVTAAIAEGKRPVPFRTRKLSPPAPMVLHSTGCGRVGHRRTPVVRRGPTWWVPFLRLYRNSERTPVSEDNNDRRPSRGDGGNRPSESRDRNPRAQDRRGDPRRSDGPPRRRGGEGGFSGDRRGNSASSDRRPPRPDEPDLPDEVEAGQLEPAVRRDLLS